MGLTRVVVRDSSEARKRLRVAITESCNLRCFFCHGEGGDIKHYSTDHASLAPSQLTQAISLLIDHGITKVKLTGGEPLQYSHPDGDIFTLIEFLTSLKSQNKFELSMVSNGILLSKACSKKLVSSGLKKINISMHSATPEGFDRYASPQTPGQFFSVLSGIENAVVAGFDTIKINSVIYHSRDDSNLSNVSQMKRILEYATALGVSEVKFYVVIENPRLSIRRHRDSMIFWDDPIFKEFYPSEIVDEVVQTLNNRHLNDIASPGSFSVSFQLNECKRIETNFTFQNFRLRSFEKSESHGLGNHKCNCQEGSYALRMLSDGTLKSCLWDSNRRNLMEAIEGHNLILANQYIDSALRDLHQDPKSVHFSHQI